MSEVTQLLEAIDQGNDDAIPSLLAIVYDELREIAARNMAKEQPGQTLQATALVNEAYLRLVGQLQPEETKNDASDTQRWKSRAHFFSAAAEAMRRILIDNARRKGRQKRGASHQRVSIELTEMPDQTSGDDVLGLNEALTRLEQQSQRKAEIVKLRFFAGLTLEEVAAALDLSVPTVHRDWRYARAWLKSEMDDREKG